MHLCSKGSVAIELLLIRATLTPTQQRGAVGGVYLPVAHDFPEQAVLDGQLRYSAQKHGLKMGEE